MCPRLIHKDGSLCHSKTYWASLNKEPPLKEFELPDLFSDNEEMDIQGNKDDMTENTTKKPKRASTMNNSTDSMSTSPVNTENERCPHRRLRPPQVMKITYSQRKL